MPGSRHFLKISLTPLRPLIKFLVMNILYIAFSMSQASPRYRMVLIACLCLEVARNIPVFFEGRKHRVTIG